MSTFLKSEYSLISSEGTARLPDMMMSCRGYYCNETGLGLSTSVCFIKSFGPRVGSGDDPLPDPSVYDTKDRLKKTSA